MVNSTVRNPRLIISRIIPVATGLMLLSVGAILVLVPLTYWWSLFILFPGLIFLVTGAVLGVALGWRNPLPLALTGIGFVVATVGAMFLLGADWEVWWPLMLIVPGAAHGLLGMIKVESPSVRPWVRMHLWLGVDVLLLGLVFLLNNFSRNAILTAWYPFHWWGIFILMPGLGAFYNAANAVRSGFDGRHLVVRSLAAFGLAACAVTLATFLNAGWALQTAAGLAAAGILFLF
ncbi:MAG: hypothetical protein JW748_01110 [Anaerolineales bacterium]|nr:hypothetical protein [Anaerolineales bacterium]